MSNSEYLQFNLKKSSPRVYYFIIIFSLTFLNQELLLAEVTFVNVVFFQLSSDSTSLVTITNSSLSFDLIKLLKYFDKSSTDPTSSGASNFESKL